jgi:predicted nucleotidyltransferase
VGSDFSKLKERWRTEQADRARRSIELRRLVDERAIPVFRRYGACKVYLFGSVAAGTAGPRSDIDMLAMPVAAEAFWRLRRDLEAALGQRLDLYTQRDDPEFVRKIMERGELIYEVQPGASEGGC